MNLLTSPLHSPRTTDIPLPNPHSYNAVSNDVELPVFYPFENISSAVLYSWWRSKGRALGKTAFDSLLYTLSRLNDNDDKAEWPTSYQQIWTQIEPAFKIVLYFCSLCSNPLKETSQD